jgi:hypothetical protein
LKREAYKHPKMLDLASRLNCTIAQAIGHVSLLIDWTADYAIQGDVGKWPNGAIARASGWEGDAEEFVLCCIASGWLDEHQIHRLILHDWPDHAERWVKAKLTAAGLAFLECYSDHREKPQGETTVATTVDTTVSTTVATPPRDQTKPNLTKPNQTKPNPSLPKVTEAEFDRWYAAYPAKVGKADARKAFEKAYNVVLAREPPKNTLDWLIEVTKRFAESPSGRAGKFCPYPATWLNAARYDDDPQAWNRDGEKRTVGHRTAGYEYDPSVPTQHSL